VRRTEAITRCIQELLISAKDEKVSRGNYFIVTPSFLLRPKVRARIISCICAHMYTVYRYHILYKYLNKPY
jgi:hypothetical protein